MAEKPPFQCNQGCGIEVKWPPWTGKPGKPINMDGSDHTCKKQTTFSKGGSGYTKMPMDQAPKILNMSQGMADSVLAMMRENPLITGQIDVNEYLQLVESIYKTNSQSYKVES